MCRLGPFFKWVLSAIWVELFTSPARSITRNHYFNRDRSEVRHLKITLLKCPSRCLHDIALYSEQNSFPYACGKWFLWLPSITIHILLFPPSPLPPLYFLPSCLLSTVDGNTWAQVIALYPTLVECITCSSTEVSSALKEALGPFKDFMQPPVSRVQNGESWPGSLTFVFL